MHIRSFVLFLLLCTAFAIIGTEDLQEVHINETLHYTSYIDWSKRVLHIEINNLITNAEGSPLNASFRADQEIRRELPFILTKVLLNLRINSRQKIEDLVNQDSGLLSTLRELSKKITSGPMEFSTDLQMVTRSYTLPLSPYITDILIKHETAIPMPEYKYYVASADFSGLVIYAKGELPVRGEDENSTLEPSVFMQLMDNESNVILNHRMLHPVDLSDTSMVYYTTDPNDPVIKSRAGLTPLMITAAELYGINDTDIILKKRDVDKLLSRESNRKMLTQGRIVIIY